MEFGIKDFEAWSKVKTLLDQSNHLAPPFKEGEIWWCYIGDNIGTEISGKGRKYSRPVLILKKIDSSSFIGLPILGKRKNGPWYVVFSLDGREQSVFIPQVKYFDYRRVDNLLGELPDEIFEEVHKRFIKYMFDNVLRPPSGESGRTMGASPIHKPIVSVSPLSSICHNLPMNQEYEVKFLNIDVPTIEAKILSLGATKVGDFFYKRIIFDYPGLPLNAKGAWLRLRDEGDRVTLTWKKRLGMTSQDGSTSDEGMEEIEVVVSDFEKTAAILRSLGMIDKFYQENRRTRYKKGKVEFDIDYWPRLNPYLEIEGHSWQEVDAAITDLGLNPADKRIFSANQVYLQNGIDEHDYTHMSFEKWVKKVV
ncbi:MAG: CYTH domain-containing protein [Patescibacteria group bacterium]